MEEVGGGWRRTWVHGLQRLPARADLDIGGLGVFRTGTSRQKGRLRNAYSVRSATIG